jgi:hypothetical protein
MLITDGWTTTIRPQAFIRQSQIGPAATIGVCRGRVDY